MYKSWHRTDLNIWGVSGAYKVKKESRGPHLDAGKIYPIAVHFAENSPSGRHSVDVMDHGKGWVDFHLKIFYTSTVIIGK